MSGVLGTTLSPLVNLTSVSHLYLSDSDTTHQPFPIWISNLTYLVTLELYNYSLHGSIPSTVLALPHLRNLNLSHNPNLKVNLSSIVQDASQLSRLSIEYSNLGGVIPNAIGNMSSLTLLNLWNNKIEGIIPPTIGNMSSLTYLNFGENKIEGIIPPAIGNMSSMMALDLSYNSLRGPIPWSYLGGLSKLSNLDLQSNQLNGSLPSTISNLSSLEFLDLGNNYLSVTFSLAQLDCLTKNNIIGSLQQFLHNRNKFQLDP